MYLIITLLVHAALATGAAGKINRPGCRAWLGDLRTFVAVDRSQRPNNSGLHEDWPVDGEAMYEEFRYNAFFAPALGGRPIEDAARGRHVLDVFGSAVFSREPAAFKSLTGLRRRAGQYEENISRANSRARQRRVVFGDVMRPSTWRRLDEDAHRRRIPAYDLVLVRPIGPLTDETTYFLKSKSVRQRRPFFAFSHLLLNRLWRRTSDDGGKILVDVNEHVRGSREFRDWIAELEKRGIDVRVSNVDGYYEFEDHVVVLTKHPGAPRRLP